MNDHIYNSDFEIHWNESGVIPPFPADRCAYNEYPPYLVSIGTFTEFFSKQLVCRNILASFLSYRLRLYDIGLINGFQVVGGSFIDSEAARGGKPPSDIDVISFFDHNYAFIEQHDWVRSGATSVEQEGHVDTCGSNVISLKWAAHDVIQKAAQWYGMLSQSKSSEVRRGLLKIKLSPEDDKKALEFLNHCT